MAVILIARVGMLSNQPPWQRSVCDGGGFDSGRDGMLLIWPPWQRAVCHGGGFDST